MPLVVQLAQMYLKLLTKKLFCMLGRVAQNVAHTHKLWVLVFNYTRVWRERNLAQCKGVERVNSLVARLARCYMNNNLGCRGRIIIKILNLNLTLLLRLGNRLL